MANEKDGNWLGQHSSPVTEKWWDFSTAPQAENKGMGEVPDMSAFKSQAPQRAGLQAPQQAQPQAAPPQAAPMK